MTVFLGANDAALNSGQHVPLERYSQNLRDMVSLIRNCNKTACVVLITPPPIHDEAMLAMTKVWMGANFNGFVSHHTEFCFSLLSV